MCKVQLLLKINMHTNWQEFKKPFKLKTGLLLSQKVLAATLCAAAAVVSGSWVF